MKKGLIGKKIGMTQVFDAQGNAIPVTVVEAGPCTITRRRQWRTKTLKEFRLDDISAMNVGDILKADIFAPGEKIDVKGTSKGKGTAGAIKRWNFSRLRMSHGTGPNARHAGSLGACSSPSRVFKGKKMAGHLGHETVTVQNLEVVKVDAENNLIAIKGAVPGPKGGIVVIADAVKA